MEPDIKRLGVKRLGVKRLGVLGDIHAEHLRLASALEYMATCNVDAIVCTGDIVDGTGCPNQSVRLLQAADAITVRGNHDRWILEDKARHITDAHFLQDLDDETIGYLSELPTQVSLTTSRGQLLLCHGVADDDLKKVWPGTERMEIERSRRLDTIIEKGHYRYLINGHMHFRTLIHFESLILINAGTLRGDHWPGFSVIDFDSHEITAFEFVRQTIHEVRKQPLIEDSHVVWRDTRSFCGGWDPVRLF